MAEWGSSVKKVIDQCVNAYRTQSSPDLRCNLGQRCERPGTSMMPIAAFCRTVRNMLTSESHELKCYCAPCAMGSG